MLGTTTIFNPYVKLAMGGYPATKQSHKLIMSTTVANASIEVQIQGFTYIKDFAFITFKKDDKINRVIIGSKTDCPMSEMFIMKQASSVTLTALQPKTVNGVEYLNYRLESINF